MATSGSFENIFARDAYALRVEWKVNSQSIANNNSNITFNVYLVSYESWATIRSSAEKNVHLVVNGGIVASKLEAGLANLSGNQKKLILTDTYNIKHDADGTKTLNVKAVFDIDVTISGTGYDTVNAPASGTKSFTLDRIPRTTTPTTSGTLNVGSTITINTPSVVSGFTHTLQYSLDKSTWTNIATNVSSSVLWTLPSSLATAKPSAKTGTVYIRCITYNESSNIGNVVISRTYNITSSYAAPAVALAASQTNSAGLSLYVRGESAVTIKATASLKYGASATKYVFTYGGVTKTITTSKASESVTLTLPANAAASYEYSVVLTDSRGYTASKSGTISTAAYTAPRISSLTATRGIYDGTTFTESGKGNSLLIAVSGSITSLSNLNSKTYTIEYRLHSETTYTTLVQDKTAASYDISVVEITDALFSENAAYVLRFALSDGFQTVTQIIDIPSQKVLLNFSANGKAMAIGGIASIDDVLEIMLESYITGGNKPMQIANGTDFNELTKTGIYTGNASSGGYINSPLGSGTFLLEVAAGGDAGQRIQRVSYCSKTAYRALVRVFYQSEWGEWFPVEGFLVYNIGAYYGQIKHANGFMIQWGRVSVTPAAANETTAVKITYPQAFAFNPIVQAQAHTSAPSILSCSIGTGGTADTTIYLTRSNTTATWVSWVAIGRGSV